MKHVLALTLATVVAALAAGGAFAAQTHASAGAPVDVVVSALANGKGYNTKKLTAPAGTQFLLVFKNQTTKQHDVALEQGELEYGATVQTGKGTVSAIFTLKKGTYHFYSSVGNDENVGFSGTLIVK